MWIADTIVEGIPRSNGMLAPAIAGFDWERRAKDHDCPYGIATAVDRHEDARFLRALQNLNPHYRLAWTALTEGVADFDQVHIASMSTLLGVIQYQRPGLLDDVDTVHFERWNEFLDDRRKAERQDALLATIEPAPPLRPVLEATKAVGLITIGVLIDIGALLVISNKSLSALGIFVFLILATTGSVFIAVGRERRANLKRQTRKFRTCRVSE
jgi:hypothetical protein